MLIVWRRFANYKASPKHGWYSFSTLVFPGASFDNESSKENQLKVPSLSKFQDVDMDLSRNVRY